MLTEPPMYPMPTREKTIEVSEHIPAYRHLDLISIMYAYHLVRLIIMRASFSESGRAPILDSCNLEQSGLRLCFLNGIKLKKYCTISYGLGLVYNILGDLIVRRRDSVLVEQSEFEPWLGTQCDVLGQDRTLAVPLSTQV